MNDVVGMASTKIHAERQTSFAGMPIVLDVHLQGQNMQTVEGKVEGIAAGSDVDKMKDKKVPPLLNFLEAVVEWGMDKELAVVVVADGSATCGTPVAQIVKPAVAYGPREIGVARRCGVPG